MNSEVNSRKPGMSRICFSWWAILVFVFLCIAPSTVVAQSPIIIRHVDIQNDSVTDTRSCYPLTVLRLVLDKSGVPYKLVPTQTGMQQERALAQLGIGKSVDVVWTMTSIEREKQLLPVRIPLDKGLLGFRLLLIHRDSLEAFHRIDSLEGLKPLTAVQGHDWPDLTILKSNGLSVEGNPVYEGMFLMLKFKRIDYFPRSVGEIWAELEQHKEMGIVVEPSLMLYYPTAEYFFVNKGNTVLADLLLKGFNTAIRDGSFDQLFKQYNQKAIQDLKGRRVIKLTNPLLPPETPINRKELWFSPE